jgi:hypothetical protein
MNLFKSIVRRMSGARVRPPHPLTNSGHHDTRYSTIYGQTSAQVNGHTTRTKTKKSNHGEQKKE